MCCWAPVLASMGSCILLINARAHPRDITWGKYSKTSQGKVKAINTHMHEYFETCWAFKSVTAYTYIYYWLPSRVIVVRPVEVLTKPSL